MDSRIKTLESVLQLEDSNYTAARSDSAGQVLVNKDKQQSTTHLDKYDTTLGPQAPDGKRHGIAQKLLYGFFGAKDHYEYTIRTRPSADASIFETVL